MLRIVTLFIAVSFLWSDFVLAQEKSINEYSRILRKSNTTAKYNAAREILQNRIVHERLEGTLLRALLRNKDLERNKTFLEAYLLQVSDPSKEHKGYEEFVDNIYTKRWPRETNKSQAQLDELLALTTLNDIRPSLLSFLQTKNAFGKRRQDVQNYIIQQLLKEQPSFARHYIDLLPDDAANNLSMLLYMEREGLSEYIDEIRDVVEIAPANALYLLQRAGSITEREIDVAIESIEPIDYWQVLFGTRMPNAIAAEILAANAHRFEKASDKLVEMVGGGQFSLFQHALSMHPIVDPDVNSKILNGLVTELAEIDYSNPSLKSSICLYLRHFEIEEESQINSIVFAARFAATPLERASCTIALTKVKTVTKDLNDYLSHLTIQDAEKEIGKAESYGDVGEVLMTQYIRRGGKYNLSFFNPINGPDFSILYKAGLSLTIDGENENAWAIVEKFFDANVDYVRQVRDLEYTQNRQFKTEIPVAAIGYKDRMIYAIDVTSMDIIAGAKHRQSEAEWLDFIFENLTTIENVRTVNAVTLINQYGVLLDNRFEEKILKLAEEDESEQLPFLGAIRYLYKTDKVKEFLQKRLESEKEHVARAAIQLLGSSLPTDL